MIVDPLANYSRCLAAARQLNTGDVSVVHKSDYPTKTEFDDALDQLADRHWNIGREPRHRAYGRALDSEEGQLLYSAREWAPHAEPVAKQEPALTPAQKQIYRLVHEYQRTHPGIPTEKALVKALKKNPKLYRDYLRECC
jgi:hypothetical protein